MIQKLQISFLSIILFGVFLLVPASLANAQTESNEQTADIPAATCQGAKLKFLDGQPPANNCQFEDANPNDKLNALIASIINIFSVVVGIVAVIMIIIGGFRYITSGGDSGNVTSAKNTILYAIVGLVIVALSQFIVKFVLSKATGVGGTSF